MAKTKKTTAVAPKMSAPQSATMMKKGGMVKKGK